tara:strand:+ start:469 stop:654 length:186 start_codon:yes stop_codon:yes gene_type:complete
LSRSDIFSVTVALVDDDDDVDDVDDDVGDVGDVDDVDDVVDDNDGGKSKCNKFVALRRRPG